MRLGTRQASLCATVLVILWAQCAHAAGQYSIRFRDELQISSDLVLKTVRGSSSVRFMCESGGKPSAGSTLHLFVEHSPDLDSNRSFLSVTLNYGVLRSVRLDERNRSTTEITIPLPPEMLRPDNEITFSVEQFPAGRNSLDLWTAIKPSSFIAVQYEDKPASADLSRLPSPFVDQHSYRPQQLFVLLPDRPSSQTIEATALLIANYAARFGALTVQAAPSIDAARGNLLIVGTPGEQPIASFANRLPFRPFRAGREIRLGGSAGPFDARDGVVALIPKPGKAAASILLVTGNSPEAISRAARTVIDGHLDAGRFAVVPQDIQTPAPLARRQWKSFAPPNTRFTLAEMGLQELKFDPENNFSRTLPIDVTPDAQFPDYGCEMTLAFRFGNGVNVDNATLDVNLNGAQLSSLGPADVSTGSTAFRVKIPGERLRRQSVLKLAWRGLKAASEKDGAIWLLLSSEFVLPRDYRWQLPDLALLQQGLYPFSLRADLSDVMLVLPDEADAEVTAAVFDFAGLLGRLVPTGRFAFGVRRQSELSRESKSFPHRIEFRIGKLPNGSASKGAVAVIQERVANAQHYTLTITSPSGRGLAAAIKTVFLDGASKQLRDDTAFIYPNKVVSVKTAPVLQISEYSYFNHLNLWLRQNWIALPVILTVVSFLLFVGLRLVLVQYKNRRSVGGLQAFDFTSSSGPRNPL